MGSFIKEDERILVKRFWMLKLLNWNTVNTEKSKKRKLSLRALYKLQRIQRKSHRNFRIPVLKNSIKSLENIRGGAFWFNFFWQKHSITGSCFWDYLWKPSEWFSALETQSLEYVRIVLNKYPWWCTFLILANKAFHDYGFPVIFSNISEGLF